MKPIFILAVFAAVLLSCSAPQLSPLEQALSDKVVEGNPGLEKVELSGVTPMEEVTLSQELARRKALFETKLKTEKKMKSPKRQKDALHVADILEALELYGEQYADQKDSIIYKVYDFEVSGKMADGSKVEKTRMSAAVDCNGNVLKLFVGENPNVHSGMGIALPHYKELLESLNANE